ncbi:hypothetical protein [Bradyrhizobium lablabi]|uniref:Uncharacterized protein n=1 Tax=Bradyrhizobium lablabi TaxID=722472 RepID=A0A1H5JHX5_9BRAD|nr:hypothetical protein [Bradyrhizobium lablabi]SEE51591.1 hypothetical protein SAMN05444171_7814 [Bradyrhizobium lablabi]SEE53117.1 hypothetical protein SAMN05444171_7881 [Bradyrhizobium lablabi]
MGWSNAGYVGDDGWYKNKAVATYTGPGDIISFLAFGSVARGYSAAYAAPGNNPAVTIVDNVGAHSTIINILSTGLIDTAAISSFIASFGTPTISKLWDQSGTGNHWIPANTGVATTLALSQINGLPAMIFSGASQCNLKTGVFAAQANPFTFMAVGSRTGSATNQCYVGTSDVNCQLFGSNVANTKGLYAGTTTLTTTGGNADGSFNVMQGTFTNSTASTLNVTGATQATGTNPGANGITGAGTIQIGAASANGNLLNGSVAEAGVYAAVYNSTVQSNTRTAYGL